jgi:diguanylate cyclase (GGDEF)-like protein
MMLHYNSLLLALGVSAACLGVILLGSWLARRPETYLLTCAIGVACLVAGIIVYGAYVSMPVLALGIPAFIFFQLGVSVAWSAGYQFREGRLSPSRIMMGSLAGIALSVPPLVAGYDGLAFIFQNVAIALTLFATAREYWLARAEAPGPIYGISGLFVMNALSFLMCAAKLIWDGKLVLGQAPDNLVEDISLGLVIAGMTGIGALSLALHHSRQSAQHRREAMTDPLTGLLNRRALMDLYGQRRFDTSMAVIAFDIDYFKSVNDQHGHAAGDSVIKFFSEELLAGVRSSNVAARIGGEEFVLIVNDVLPGRAEQIADRIREAFAMRELQVEAKILRCTVSAGVASGSNEGSAFEHVLRAADGALYAAKHNGRNRVEMHNHLHAVPPSLPRTAET